MIRCGANLYWQRADNTGEVQRLTDSKNGQGAWSWHPNGKVLAFHETHPCKPRTTCSFSDGGR